MLINKNKIMSEKTIKIVQGGTPTAIVTNAKTWGEFKKEIKGEITLPKPHVAILGETTMGLLDESILPETVTHKGKVTNTYHVFITPKKSKSGGDFSTTPYRECKKIIKEIRTGNDTAKDFFGDYTHMTTDKLRGILTKWTTRYGELKKSGEIKSSKKKDKKEKKKDKKNKKGKKVKPGKELVEKMEEIKAEKVSNSLTIETSTDAVEVLESIITFLKNSNKGSKVIFTMNEVTEKDYKKFEKMSK